MATTYAHSNIIAKDWRALADFYQQVFDCVVVPPERNQAGDWLSRGTAVKEAALQGVHLRLPGWGDAGPTLEIYSYQKMLAKPEPQANRLGLGHLAFVVDDVADCLQRVIAHGGQALGELGAETLQVWVS